MCWFFFSEGFVLQCHKAVVFCGPRQPPQGAKDRGGWWGHGGYDGYRIQWAVGQSWETKMVHTGSPRLKQPLLQVQAVQARQHSQPFEFCFNAAIGPTYVQLRATFLIGFWGLPRFQVRVPQTRTGLISVVEPPAFFS